MQLGTRVGLPLLALFVLAWGGVRGQAAAQAPTHDEVVLVPHAVERVRALVPLDARMTVYHWGGRADSIRLHALRLEVDGVELARVELDEELVANARYGELNALVERLPHELSHRHADVRYFAPAGAPEFDLREGIELLPEIRREVAALREVATDEANWPVREFGLRIELDQVFFPDAEPGTRADALWSLDYSRPDGSRGTLRRPWSLVWLGPLPGVPPTYLAQHAGASLHAGDLHVHSCHGEALGACAPSDNCTAESLQTSGSFSYAELRTQYEALGLDWFTATDHSYCINSNSEYQAIVAEIDAITDASFVAFPDIEVSSDEVGPQQGSDLANALCLGTTAANHMGAHGISARIEGGDDGLLGFCDGLFSDVLDDFDDNIAAVRAQGGLPIANHPAGSSFAWNSFDATVGIEAGALHGVEIWNGETQRGQGGNVAAWVDWLLAGRVLYAYSGSDTHDAAFDFGANRVLLDGASFDRAGILAALEAGRVTVSDGPALVIEALLGGSSLAMGQRVSLPSPPPSSNLELRAHYDFGAGSGVVEIWRGRVGDGSETLLCQSPTLSGAGVFTCGDTLPTSARSWYRAYAEGTGSSSAAYTNPIFLEPGLTSIFRYCSAKPNSDGCEPPIEWSGTPSATAGSGFVLEGRDVLAGQNGLLIYSANPNYLPFQGGTLCLAGPIIRTPIQNAGGGGACGGLFSFDFNDWIVNGHDGSLGAGVTRHAQYWYRDPGSPSFPTGLTDAVQFTIGP